MMKNKSRDCLPVVAVAEPLKSFKTLMWMIHNEPLFLREWNNPGGIDYLVIPYLEYGDEAVHHAIKSGVQLVTLEHAAETLGLSNTFDTHPSDKPGAIETASIKEYCENMDHGFMSKFDKNAITEFRDENFFLSNFYACTVTIGDKTYMSAEAAFQAQKCVNPSDMDQFTELTPGQAKKRGRKVKLRSDWEDVKVEIMTSVVRAKFTQHRELAEKLFWTSKSLLVEGNSWKDTFWGVCNGKGRNMLGRILMQVRSEIPVEFVLGIKSKGEIKNEYDCKR